MAAAHGGGELETARMTHRDEQRHRARRTAIVLGLAAVALYAGFIWMTVSRAHG